jgi:hypothetical protein
MRNRVLGAVQLAPLFIVGAVGAAIVIWVVIGTACDGKCASVACTEQTPCIVGGKKYIDGSACAAGVYGSVCRKHWWPFASCLCTDVVSTGGLPRPSCVK